MKGETIDEITACAQVMRESGLKLQSNGEVLDIVGTGGDQANTFNISTVSAFVVSAAGIPVAKHGNRSVSSKCGSADVLEALGVKLIFPWPEVKRFCRKWYPLYVCRPLSSFHEICRTGKKGPGRAHDF